MTIRELINGKPSSITGVENFADFEVYRFTGRRHDLHTDCIEKIEEPSLDTEVEMWTLMDQEEYNNTILANSSIPADFAEWYDDADAKVLVIIASRTEIRYIISAETFEAPFDKTWTTDELIDEWESQSWNDAEVIEELHDADEARKAFENEKNRAYTFKRQGVAGAYLEVKIIRLEAAYYEDGELDHADELDIYAEPFCDEE